MNIQKYYAGITAKCRINESQLKALASVYSSEELESIFNILAIKQFKNPKREVVAQKIRSWLAEPTHLTSRPITPYELNLIKLVRTPAWLLQLKQTSTT